MKTPTSKSVAPNSGKSTFTTLGVRMKSQNRLKSQENFLSRCPKTLSIDQNVSKPININDNDLAAGSKPGTRTLPSSWNSPSRDFKDISDLVSESSRNNSSCVHKPVEVKTKNDETFTVKFPLKEKLMKSRSNKSQEPKLQNPSTLQLFQQLRKKDSEITSFKEKLQKQTEDQDGKIKKLEVDLNYLQNDITKRDTDIVILNHENLKLQETLQTQLMEMNILQRKLQEVKNIETEVKVDLNAKNHEIAFLQQENLVLEGNIEKQKEEIQLLQAEVKKLSELPEYNASDLEKETADFLEKISAACKNKSLKVKALSKDKNVKINLKVTVRKEKLDKVSHQLSFSEAFESPNVLAKTPCQSFCVNEEYEDEVFCDNPCESTAKQSVNENSDSICDTPLEQSKEFIDNELTGNESLDVNLNSDFSNVSIGTFTRTDELDIKMRELWTRLSSQSDTLEELKLEKRKFTSSVDMLEEELSESFIQHTRLMDQVNVVKKLFC